MSCPDTKPKLSVAKPYQPFQIVDTPNVQETHLILHLQPSPNKQTNRTLVGQYTYPPELPNRYGEVARGHDQRGMATMMAHLDGQLEDLDRGRVNGGRADPLVTRDQRSL
jgi:hypothetical protein